MRSATSRFWNPRAALAGALLVAAVVFSYQPAWHAGFIWDDNDYVTENPLLTAPDGLHRIWFSTDSPSQYFPMVYTTFRAERRLWDLNASGFHWVNILLHATNALLVWQLLRRLGVPAAWFAAALFALHPVQVESVAWVTELKNVQSLFFFLLALFAWLAFLRRTFRCRAGSPDPAVTTQIGAGGDTSNSEITCRTADVAVAGAASRSAPPSLGTRRPRCVACADPSVSDSSIASATAGSGDPALHPGNSATPGHLACAHSAWFFYVLALFFHALALFSKTTACTLPAALVLILWLQRERLTVKRWLQVVPFVGLSLAMGVVSIWWERHHQGTEGAFYALSWLDRFLVASRALWFYIGKLLWPANLTFSYPFWHIDRTAFGAYGWLFALAVAGGAIGYARRFVGRGVEVGAAFFVAMLFPMLGFFMMYTFKYTFVADHYQYVAIVGPAALVAAGLHRLVAASTPRTRVLGYALGSVLLGLLSTLTWRQAHMYKDLETLWRTTIARNPDSYMGHNNLGAIFLARGEVDDALAHFERALQIFPDHANAHGNLAQALLRKGRIDDALVHFRKAAEIEPQLAKSHSDLAFGLVQAGQTEQALAEATKAVELQPDAAEPHHVLGLALLAAGNAGEAANHFRRAVQLRPDYVEAERNLGNALLQAGRNDDAVVELSRYARIDPTAVDVRYNLAIALFKTGRLTEAIPHFQAVADAQPSNAEAQNNLGWSLLQGGRVDEAMDRFRAVLRLQPDFAVAHCNLAMALVRKRDARAAIEEYQSFLAVHPDAAPVLSEIAWLLATWPEDAVRDGARAVQLARRANEIAGGQDPRIMRTLAAAYAEGGQFSDAVATVKRALELADSQPAGVLRDDLLAQLAGYEKGAPFRDRTAGAPQPN